MDELKKRLADEIKKLKGIADTELDDVFSFAIDTAIFDVLNYCHIEVADWPEALDNTAVMMAIDVVNMTCFASALQSDDAGGDVRTLTEGDFTISKETKAEAYQKIMTAPSFAKNYRRNLNRFRRTAR